MAITFLRLVRTPSSERYMLQVGGVDAAACDLHFLAEGKVAGTLILFEGGPLSSRPIEEILGLIDVQLLPHVSLGEKNLAFTVIQGRVVGSYEPNP